MYANREEERERKGERESRRGLLVVGFDFRGREIACLAAAIGPIARLAAAPGPLAHRAAALGPLVCLAAVLGSLA